MSTLNLKLGLLANMTDDQFFDLSQKYADFKLERNAQGDLIVMPPTGGDTGNYNFELTTEFGIWNRQTKLGVGFDSSTGFKLPNGAERSPDVAWIKKERWDALTPEQQRKFPPICPDFILELMSSSENLAVAQAKMQEFQANGVKLGWLIQRQTKRVEIYRSGQPTGQPMEVLIAPQTLSGENILPGFVLDMNRIW